MTTIVGIFDDSISMEKAINNLHEKGYKEKVVDEVTVAQEMGSPSGPLFIPGSGLAPGSAKSAETTIDWKQSEAIRIFKTQLSGLHLSNQQFEGYINHFIHGGKFVIVKASGRHTADVKDIMYAANASQVNEH